MRNKHGIEVMNPRWRKRKAEEFIETCSAYRGAMQRWHQQAAEIKQNKKESDDNATVGPRYKAFMTAKEAEGYHPFVIGNLPGAEAAMQADREEANRSELQRTTEQWLGTNKGKGFASVEDREAAFADKRYRDSQSYRDAVAEMAANTSDEIMGLVRPHRNVPNNESMLKQARFEAYQEGRAELFAKSQAGGPGAARARLQLMEYDQSADPEVKAMIAEHERTYAETHPIETQLRALQATGSRVGTPLVASHEQEQAVEAHPYDAFAVDAAPKGEPGSEWR